MTAYGLWRNATNSTTEKTPPTNVPEVPEIYFTVKPKANACEKCQELGKGKHKEWPMIPHPNCKCEMFIHIGGKVHPIRGRPWKDPKYQNADDDTCGSGWNSPIVPEKPEGFDFTEACRTHDECYGLLGAVKEECDKQLFWDMIEGNEDNIYCVQYATTYHFFVDKFGHGPYERAQKEARDQHRSDKKH